MTKALNVIESAYRATFEEQDDTIVWITHALRGAGADVDVLLEGNAVNYAVKGQDAAGLRLGDWKQTQPPRLEQDLSALLEKGAKVHLVQEDLAERGLERTDLVEGMDLVTRSEVAGLMEKYDRVWRW